MWDWKEISRDFLKKAVEADTQLWELQANVHDNQRTQQKYDSMLATFAVYHHLWGRPFLESPQKLVQELYSILSHSEDKDKAYDCNWFLSQRKHLIKNLIKVYREL